MFNRFCEERFVKKELQLHDAMHAKTTGTKRIIVLLAGTDVTVILLFYWQRLKVHGLTELRSRLVKEIQLLN